MNEVQLAFIIGIVFTLFAEVVLLAAYVMLTIKDSSEVG